MAQKNGTAYFPQYVDAITCISVWTPHFHILKLLFPSIFCRYFRYFVSETYISRSQNTMNAVSSYYLWYVAIIKQRASGASELRKNSRFYILKLQFLSIFCCYFRYFVGTNDILVGLYMYTDKFPNVPTKLQKSIKGGGQMPPCPLATLVVKGSTWRLLKVATYTP